MSALLAAVAPVAQGTDWYAPLRAVQSLGAQDAGPGGLAGLAAARARHLGQFFTPDAIARLMWSIAARAMPTSPQGEPARRYAVLDNSVGSARLPQFADPALHHVGGLDVHAPTIERVQATFEAAGFSCDFRAGGMEGARAAGWSVALINPPFSLHLESPLLRRSIVTTHGRYGPGTSARSERYALVQALEAAEVVVALLPRSAAAWVESLAGKDWSEGGAIHSRWRATLDLPVGSFASEGADVEVSLCIFGSMPDRAHRHGRIRLAALDAAALPDFGLACTPLADTRKARLRFKHVQDERPTITLPVTGDATVRLSHDGRRLRLRFGCGFTQARVLNGVLIARNRSNDGERLAAQYPYEGSARLDLEAHIASGDAAASLARLVADIEAQGARVVCAPGLARHLARRERASRRQAMPLAHHVWDPMPAGSRPVTARARVDMLADPSSWFGWVIEAGEVLAFERQSDGRLAASGPKGAQLVRTPEELAREFDVIEAGRAAAPAGWRKVHDGLMAAYPQQARALRLRAERLGIPAWLDWGYQIDDLIELALKPAGAVIAWDMGLGKTRLAVALALLTGAAHTLVAMDAYLLPEFASKLAALPIAREDWQVIESPAQARRLARINLIAYERIRMPIREGARQTYAHLMRRRVGLAIADEGEILANPHSAQSRALYQLAAHRRFVMTGTPIANYPRDAQPVLAWVAGDGTAAQPWGFRGPHMEPRLAASAIGARRGVDAFRDAFVTTEWVTNEFCEDNRSGAKREVPKIRHLPEYRAMLAPHVKRRVTAEPEVQRHVQIPEPRILAPRVVEFDEAHLGHYIRVADDFAQWWARARAGEAVDARGRRVNPLVLLLVRIGAVVRANNVPQHAAGAGFAAFSALTSKQRAALARIEDATRAGEKVIVFVQNPATVELFARELAPRGVPVVRAHGGIPIARRHAAIQKDFRGHAAGAALVATFGVTQAGIDLPEAHRVIFYERDWTARAESQAMRRALRPQTRHTVEVEYLHLRGSIDEYMAQMVEFKRDAFHAGVDWAAPEYDEAEFLHMDTIIERFVRDLAALRGMSSGELRDELKRLAA